jgi:Domain of unknown function (DUF4258)
MAIRRFIWTDHAELRLEDRGFARVDIENAIREGHLVRSLNLGDADWRIHGVRSDSRPFAVIYDHPVRGDKSAVRIVSMWSLRRVDLQSRDLTIMTILKP